MNKKRIIVAVIIVVLAGMFSFQEWQISKLNAIVTLHDKVLGNVVNFLNQAIEASKPK